MKLKVVESHTSNYPNPISFKAGEILQIGKRDTEYKGWVRVTTSDGNEGWAPEQYIDGSITPAKAISDYSATELNTSAGEILDSTKVLNEWAWVTNSTGHSGWVPVKTTVCV